MLKDKLMRWELFKENLPHLHSPYSKRNWGNELHSVCSYQGKMKPSLAHHLIKVFSNENEKILDPFSGSGTIPFEAVINNRISFGIDISSMATAVSNAKLLVHNRGEINRIINSLNRYIETQSPSKNTLSSLEHIHFNKKISEYFHVDTLNEILLARDFFLLNPYYEKENWSLVIACMLHILHGNRPYALSRNSHPITPYAPTGDFVYKNLIDKLTTKVNKSLIAQENLTYSHSICFQNDILNHWNDDIKDIDLILTSPPFFDSTRFYMSNWMRYWFCGWGMDDFENKPKSFIEVIQKKGFSVYDYIFRSCYERLNDNGIVVFHLGSSDKCDMANSIAHIAEKYFFIHDIFTESVEHCESHGIDKGSVKGHQYLVLLKNRRNLASK